MNQTIIDNLFISGYLLLWILTFVWYHFRIHRLDGGSAIMGTYILYAISSIISLNDELFSIQYEPLKIFPFIYLYIMLMIALSPTVYHHFHPVTKIADPNTRILKPICWVLIVCAIIQIPDIISNFQEGLIKLFTDVSAGQDAYKEQQEGFEDVGTAVRNVPSIIYNVLYDVSIFLAFYYLSRKEKHLFFTVSVFLAAFIGLLIPVMRGERGSVITNLLTIVLGYMMFQEYLPTAFTRWFRRMGIIAMVLIMLPIAAITVSRFGERNAGVWGYLNWYVGQENLYFNNYVLDPGGVRYGDRTMNLFKRFVDSSTPRNFMERREKYYYLEIDDYYFTTFVGDFVLDFGPLLAFLIFVVFNLWVIAQVRPRDGDMPLHQLLLIYFTGCICMQGGMTLFSYSDGGNLKIIFTLSLYAYLRYHEQLLQKFPLLSKSPHQ